jgi:hypothetical protein
MVDVALSTHYSGDVVEPGKLEIATYHLQVWGFVGLAATRLDPWRGLNGTSSKVPHEGGMQAMAARLVKLACCRQWSELVLLSHGPLAAQHQVAQELQRFEYLGKGLKQVSFGKSEGKCQAGRSNTASIMRLIGYSGVSARPVGSALSQADEPISMLMAKP